jgi:hypothetical protein
MSINKQHMSQYIIYLQTVNIVALVNCKRTAFFPENSKPDYIQSPR